MILRIKSFKRILEKLFFFMAVCVGLLIRQIDCQELTHPLQFHQFKYELQQKHQQLYQHQQNEYQKLQMQQQQQNSPSPSNENRFQSQMLKTGASLVVDDGVTGLYRNANRRNDENGNGSALHARRRPGGRKRKRRPTPSIVSTLNPNVDINQYWGGHVEDDATIVSSTFSPTQGANSLRNRQPFITNPNKVFERIHAPMDALESEHKLSLLPEKQRKEFVTEAATTHRDKSYRKPYSQAKRGNLLALNESLTVPKTSTDLKNILKNSGGLSLSEILQQRNLSLDDLLKGKENALQALQGTTATSQLPIREQIRLPKPSRKPPVKRNQTEHRIKSATPNNYFYGFDQNNPRLPASHRVRLFGMLPLQAKTTPSNRISDAENATTRSSTTTLPSFQRTLALASETESNTEEIFTTLTTEPFLSTATASELTPLIISQDSTTYRIKTIVTDLNVPIEESLNKSDPEANNVDNNDSSVRSKLNIATLPSQFFAKNEHNSNEEKMKTIDRLSEQNDVDDNSGEAFRNYGQLDDRTDILELIEDRHSGNELFKVLGQRNMTLEELIEHRKRGSSQLHLTSLVQNSSQFFPGEKVVVENNMDIVTAFENFPHFNLMNLKSVKPDEIKTDSEGSSYFTSIIDIEPTDEILKEGNSLRDPSSRREEKSSGVFPSWKSLALASLTTKNDMKNISSKRNQLFFSQRQNVSSWESDPIERQKNNNDNSEEKQKAERHISVDPVEAIENEVARAHDLLDLELSGHGFKRSATASAKAISGALKNSMPPGIRSAIVASTAIVLTSITTFMIIFVICRWKHRRRRKPNFTETYNAMKSKLPIVSSSSRQLALEHMEELVATSPQQSSLIFPNSSSSNGSTTTRRNATDDEINAIRSVNRSSSINCNSGIATSQSSSLRNSRDTSTSKLNTMDPDSPVVQEYLFDRMRQAF